MSGNPEHCINLLQLAKEISCMMNTNTEPQALEGSGGPEEGDQESGEEVQQLENMLAEGQGESPGSKSSQKKGHGASSSPGQPSGSGQSSAQRQQIEDIDDDEGIDGIGRVEVDGFEGENYGEEEVSINLEDAIATAEEINAHEMDTNLKMQR